MRFLRVWLHYCGMARMARAVVPGVAHHLIQRGVGQQDVFRGAEDREVYLRLAVQSMAEDRVRVWAYCLMTNHVHWVVVPEQALSLARAFGRAHGRYAQHINAGLGRNGHFWQNRFFSRALDEGHTWAAVRYVECNPVRAGLVSQAEEWSWSSAPARLRGAPALVPLDLGAWRERYTEEQWRVMLASGSLGEAIERLRRNTYTGRPAGDESFVARAEAMLRRKLVPGKGGRPKKKTDELGVQGALFAAGGG